jgi:serine protease
VAGVSTASRSGGFAAQLGSATPSLTSSIAQTFTAPAGTTQLTFFYKMTCPDTVTFDWVTATLRDLTTGTTRTILPRTCATNAAYVQVTAAITAGHRYTLTPTNRDDDFAGDASFTPFDDVAVR